MAVLADSVGHLKCLLLPLLLHDSWCHLPWSRRLRAISDKPFPFPTRRSLPPMVATALGASFARGCSPKTSAPRGRAVREVVETQAKWVQQVGASFLHTLAAISTLFNLILFYLNNWGKKIGKRSLLCLPPSIRRCAQTFAMRQAFLGVVDTKQPSPISISWLWAPAHLQ